MNAPRVLVISHNVFSETSNMGKTLCGYFADFAPENIAQLYIHSEVPTLDICTRYYRITDSEAIKSIITGRSGQVLTEKNIEKNRLSPRTDIGRTARVYQLARKRTPLIYLARNMWWNLANWHTKELNNWIDDFKPEVVFLASGDYGFIYKIARIIAEERNIPLIVACVDDYYIYNKNEKYAFGKLTHKLFMRQVSKTIRYASAVFCISDAMSRDYSFLFNKQCFYTLHTPPTIKEPLTAVKKEKISYIGNLGYLRNEQLLEIGRAVNELNLEPNCIDVYSSEKRPEILSGFVRENGIIFHGEVSAEEVKTVMAESIALIHTESFDKSVRKSVKYSVSTKIADSLASGVCIFAYAPKEVASMEYLKDNNAAVCVTDRAELKNALKALLCDEELRKTVAENALRLSKNENWNILLSVCEELAKRKEK